MSDKAITSTSYKTLVKTLKQEIQNKGNNLKQIIETNISHTLLYRIV